MNDEYRARRLALTKETEKVLKQLDEYDSVTGNPKELDGLFKRIEEIQAEFEALIEELDIEILLTNVDLKLMKEGYIKEEYE